MSQLSISTPNSLLAPGDYAAVISQPLLFNPNITSVSVSIPIIDDDLDEENEYFFANLDYDTVRPNVMLDPNVTRIVIEDNDGTCMLFMFMLIVY